MLGIALAVTNFRPPPPPPEPPDPERLLKGYPWPASQLTKADMMRLTDLAEQTGEPITQLLHEAVSAYYDMLMADDSADPNNGPERSSPETQGTPAEDAHP